MKKIPFLLVILFLSLQINAQSLAIKDLSPATGHWEGKLTYLDYSSGKPYTMPAHISISLTADKKGFICSFEYPKEPQANSKDTTYINGALFGSDKIVEFKKEASGDFILVTEINGQDGNDHKNAVLRHTYQLKANDLSFRKDVRFEGTEAWIKRNEYLFSRVIR